MNEKSTGFVYLLSNPCFLGDWIKICKSPVPVSDFGSSAPLPFEVLACLESCCFDDADLLIRKSSDLLSVRHGDFINVSRSVAIGILRDAASVLGGSVVLGKMEGAA